MKFVRLLFKIVAVYFACVLVLGLAYSVVPPVSTLMLARWVTFQGVEWESVTLKKVNGNLLRAVIRAEDGRFCEHYGVDWKSMNKAIEEAGEDGPSRGASTISMQVAKNLFLWPQRSYVRKALEIPIAMYLDLIWSKRRMMEVYLSIAELGKGVFGAEAAAQKYFHKSAGSLTPTEAALLAAALPNPKKRHPARPSPGYQAYAGRIAGGMYTSDIGCLK